MNIILPIPMNPETYSGNLKTVENNSQYLINLVCSVNEVKSPNFVLGKKSRGLYGICNYRTLCLHRWKPPVKTPGFSWSFTGYKADLTYLGIIAHELGHWMDFKTKGLDKAFISVVKKEAPVSSYEPNIHEAIAEAFKLYILNPDLLKRGRPLRYEALKSFGLKTIHNMTHEEVLTYAHPKLLKASYNWMKN